MKFVWPASALVVTAISGVGRSECPMEKGNYYCSQVEAISYSNFGTAGQFSKVIEQGPGSQCTFANQSYGGGMAPFDGEASRPHRVAADYHSLTVVGRFHGISEARFD